MLKRTDILSIGSIVTIRFDGDKNDTIAMIIGHIIISEKIRCHYDYICVEYPFGIEKGLFCINCSDILNIVHFGENIENKHSEWLDYKYAEYLVCYKTGRSKFRRKIFRAKDNKDFLKNVLGTYALEFNNDNSPLIIK